MKLGMGGVVKRRMVRGGTLFGYEKAASEVGLEASVMMARVGLAESFAENPDSMISLDAFVRLLDLSAEKSGRSDFGARAAIARGVPDYGLVSLLLREEATLEDALTTYIANLHHHCNGIYIELDTRFGKPFLSFQIVSETPSIQVMEFCACGLVQLIRWLVGADWQPEAVCHEHARPAHISMQSGFFRSEIRYNQVISGILLGRDSLARQVVTSPDVLRRQAKLLIAQTLGRTADPFEAQVARLINQQLHDPDSGASTVASSLGINRRTLHRRLASKGLSYSSLLQQIRHDAAKRLVEINSIPLTEVAEATGFGSLSAFSRWFQGSFGCCASDWKQQLTEKGSSPDRP